MSEKTISRQAAWCNKNVEKGLCRCGKNEPIPGLKICEFCRSKYNAWKSKWREKNQKH